MTGHKLEIRYSRLISTREFRLWLGGRYSHMVLEYDSSEFTKSEFAFVGKMQVILEPQRESSFFISGETDRYTVSSISLSGEGRQSFIAKNTIGGGYLHNWKHLTAEINGGGILPASSGADKIRSGVEGGLGIRYDWKMISLMSRLSYLQLSTEEGGSNKVIATTVGLGYRF
jgi:hypothetical protein